MPRTIQGGAVGPIGAEAMQRTNANLAQMSANLQDLGNEFQRRREVKANNYYDSVIAPLIQNSGGPQYAAQANPGAFMEWLDLLGHMPGKAVEMTQNISNGILSTGEQWQRAGVEMGLGNVASYDPQNAAAVSSARETDSPEALHAEKARLEALRDNAASAEEATRATQALVGIDTMLQNFATSGTMQVGPTGGSTISDRFMRGGERRGIDMQQFTLPPPTEQPLQQNSAETDRLMAGTPLYPEEQLVGQVPIQAGGSLPGLEQYDQAAPWDKHSLQAVGDGETIINQAASQAFAPELEAMNNAVPNPYAPLAPDSLPTDTLMPGPPIVADGDARPMTHPSNYIQPGTQDTPDSLYRSDLEMTSRLTGMPEDTSLLHPQDLYSSPDLMSGTSKYSVATPEEARAENYKLRYRDRYYATPPSQRQAVAPQDLPADPYAPISDMAQAPQQTSAIQTDNYGRTSPGPGWIMTQEGTWFNQADYDKIVAQNRGVPTAAQAEYLNSPGFPTQVYADGKKPDVYADGQGAQFEAVQGFNMLPAGQRNDLRLGASGLSDAELFQEFQARQARGVAANRQLAERDAFLAAQPAPRPLSSPQLQGYSLGPGTDPNARPPSVGNQNFEPFGSQAQGMGNYVDPLLVEAQRRQEQTRQLAGMPVNAKGTNSALDWRPPTNVRPPFATIDGIHQFGTPSRIPVHAPGDTGVSYGPGGRETRVVPPPSYRVPPPEPVVPGTGSPGAYTQEPLPEEAAGPTGVERFISSRDKFGEALREGAQVTDPVAQNELWSRYGKAGLEVMPYEGTTREYTPEEEAQRHAIEQAYKGREHYAYNPASPLLSKPGRGINSVPDDQELVPAVEGNRIVLESEFDPAWGTVAEDFRAFGKKYIEYTPGAIEPSAIEGIEEGGTDVKVEEGVEPPQGGGESIVETTPTPEPSPVRAAKARRWLAAHQKDWKGDTQSGQVESFMNAFFPDGNATLMDFLNDPSTAMDSRTRRMELEESARQFDERLKFDEEIFDYEKMLSEEAVGNAISWFDENPQVWKEILEIRSEEQRLREKIASENGLGLQDPQVDELLGAHLEESGKLESSNWANAGYSMAFGIPGIQQWSKTYKDPGFVVRMGNWFGHMFDREGRQEALRDWSAARPSGYETSVIVPGDAYEQALQEADEAVAEIRRGE